MVIINDKISKVFDKNSVQTWEELLGWLEDDLYTKVRRDVAVRLDDMLYFEFRAELERNVLSELEK